MHEITKYIISILEQHNPSDIHARSKAPILIRKKTKLFHYSEVELTDSQITQWILEQVSKSQFEAYQTKNDLDFRLDLKGYSLRVNAFRTYHGSSFSVRVLHGTRNLQSLRMPNNFIDLFKKKSGLIILTGMTGSGKSTCIASIIEYLSTQINRHMITIEDPIEHVFKDDQIFFSQREIGRDVPTILDGIMGSLRQDPDMIFIGEIRTLDEIKSALTASETGHLVITTLHSDSFVTAIHRIIDVFPSVQQQQIVSQLSEVLLGCAALSLIEDVQGHIQLASEIVICNDAIKSVIRSKRMEQAVNYIQTGTKYGMRMLDDHIAQIRHESEKIT